MRLATLLLSSLALVTFHAHGAGALAVRNLSVDSAKQQVSFEIVNVSAQAVHSWTMTIASKKKPPAGDAYKSNPYESNLLTTSESCSRGVSAPLAPGESRNCNGSLYSGEPATVLSAEVIVTSVLFEDGSAEGDVTLLDNLARVRRSQFRYLEFWIGQLEPALAAPTPRERLQAMQKALSAPDSAIPSDLRYDPTAARERSSLLMQVASSLQLLETPQVRDPRAQAMGTVEMLKQRLNQMRTAPEAFPPRRGADLTPPVSDPLQGWKTIARTNALQLVAVRDDSSRMSMTTFFLQNVSQKPITAMAVAFGGSDERGGHSVDCFAGGPTAVCVLPGASYALSQVNASDHTLIVKAVVFEDGTSDGVQRDIDAIIFTRLGRMFETERIRSIADAADADFTSLPAKLGELPQSAESVFPSLEQVKLPGITLDWIRSADPTSRMFFLNGVRSAREGTTRNLSEYQRRNPATPAAALEEMRRDLRGLSGRYRAYCKRVYAVAK
jgi:hypothetical protein